ncbi:MAG: RNA polymerase sigma factor [Pirellula sp.]|jgi:RNA polymerase sigma-70 factor (ECF subfamily)|nr:RNA polymerase sigma factor [Pirellula sp.]
MLKSAPQENSKLQASSCASTLLELFESEESKLLRFAWSLTGRRAIAEEIVQEVFMQLHAKWTDVQEPRPWLYRSVRNQAYHHLRKSRRERFGEDGENVHPLDRSPEGATEAPDDWVAHIELMAELRGLIAQLPEKDQRLIQMKYYEDLKYRDISQRTGLTISNVGFRLHVIVKKLAASMLASGAENQ